MKRKIIIDLQKDSKIDASMEELELIRDILNDSIRLKRKEEKRKEPIENLLFEVETDDKAKIFAKSKVSEITVFEKELKEEEKLGVNLLHYFYAIQDWSTINPGKKRTEKGWIATARTWMRQDKEKGKLKMSEGDMLPMSNKDELEYLNT